jgi:hypothetical protein
MVALHTYFRQVAVTPSLATKKPAKANKKLSPNIQIKKVGLRVLMLMVLTVGL